MRDALFLHIQKTAGTSIQVLARQAYGNDNVCSHGDFLTLGLDGCAKLPFVSGHFGYAFARPLMANRYCFTILRDPIERLVSLYAFCAAQAPEDNFLYEAANRLDLDGFLALGDEMPFRHVLWNNMVWQLTFGWGHSLIDGHHQRIADFAPDALLDMARANLATFDHVGFVDTLDADMKRVFSDLGAADLSVEQHNVAARKTAISDLPDATRQRLSELTVLDRALFEQARRTYSNIPARETLLKGFARRILSAGRRLYRPYA